MIIRNGLYKHEQQKNKDMKPIFISIHSFAHSRIHAFTHFFLLSAMILFALFLGSCEDYTENYTVPPAQLVAEFTYSPTENLTPSSDIKFTNNSIIPTRITNPVFNWDFGDGHDTTITDYDEVVLERGEVRQIMDTVHYSYDSAGTYTVRLTIASGGDETSSYSNKLNLSPFGRVLFEENFESSGNIPADWKLVNGDGGTPATGNQAFQSLADSAWIVWYSGLFESHVAIATSWYNEEVDADDWMITPAIELSGNCLLSWDAVSLTSSGDYPDDYQVFVSTTDQTVQGCLDNGTQVYIDNESVGEDVGGEGIQRRELSLQDFAGETVYIGFRLVTPYPGGDRLAIDNIKVLEL